MTANDDKQKQGDFRRFVRQTIFAGLALVLVYNVTRPKGVETGQPAPTFAAETIEGKRFSIEEQEGRVVVLDFGRLGVLRAGRHCQRCKRCMNATRMTTA